MGYITTVTTLQLCRPRATTVRAMNTRHWVCMRNLKPRKLERETLEGYGNASDRRANLDRQVEQHLLQIHRHWNRIRFSELAMKR